MVRDGIIQCEICNCSVSKVHFSRHTKTKKHRNNAYNCEEARKEREKREIKKELEDGHIISIIQKLTLDEMKFIVSRKDRIVYHLNLEIRHNITK